MKTTDFYKLVNEHGSGLAVATPEALLIDVCEGNHHAGRMLWRLVHWWSVAGDRAVYKSHDDWNAELRLSKYQISIGNKILKNIGVNVYRYPAHGAPTNHYVVNDEAGLMGRIAEKLGIGLRKIIMFFKKLGDRIPKNSPVEFLKTGASITKEHNNDSTTKESSVFDATQGSDVILKIFPEKRALMLIDEYGVERVRDVCVYVDGKQGIRTPAGYAVGILKNGGAVSEVENANRKGAESDPVGADTEYDDFVDDESMCDDEVREALAGYDRADDVPLILKARIGFDVVRDWFGGDDVPVNVPDGAADAWSIAYNQLELQLDRSAFDSWLGGARLVGVEGDVFCVAVKNNYAREMLQGRLYRNVRRVLTDACGRDVEIEFSCDKAPSGSLNF